MKKNLFIIILQLTLINSVSAQGTINPITPIKNKHSVYAELFGQGFAGSLNYDLLFNSTGNWKRSFTIGVVAVPRSFDFGDGAYIGVPVSYNWLYGKKRSFLELGIGLTTQAVDNYVYPGAGFEGSRQAFSSIYTYITPKLGYRFQPYKSGLFFRATLTPHIALVNTNWSTRSGSLTSSSYFFNNVLNLGNRAFPWFGVSLGYTFK